MMEWSISQIILAIGLFLAICLIAWGLAGE